LHLEHPPAAQTEFRTKMVWKVSSAELKFCAAPAGTKDRMVSLSPALSLSLHLQNSFGVFAEEKRPAVLLSSMFINLLRYIPFCHNQHTHSWRLQKWRSVLQVVFPFRPRLLKWLTCCAAARCLCKWFLSHIKAAICFFHQLAFLSANEIAEIFVFLVNNVLLVVARCFFN